MKMFDAEKIRNRFPSIINNPNIIFFDNAATTQKPDVVLDVILNYYKNNCANTGRGSYKWANLVTEEIKKVRKKVANFINVDSPNEIVFTSGATDSMNTIVFSWALHNLKDKDEILLCSTDHKSTVLPWINLKDILKNFGITIKIVYIRPDQHSGDYVFDDIRKKVNTKTKFICVTHIHNLYGVDMGVNVIREIVGKDVVMAVDTCQSVGHKNVDVKHLGADFILFSGHKMFAETGVGVLWVNKRLHEQLKPFKIGGGYFGKINWENCTIEKTCMPDLLECGTINIAGVLSLGKAIDFIEEIGISNIETHLIELTSYLLDKLKNLNLEIEFLPGPIYCSTCALGYGIVGFKIKGISSADIGYILSENNIQVRTGNHCIAGETIHSDNVRVSFHIYNTTEEIDRFINVLSENIT